MLHANGWKISSFLGKKIIQNITKFWTASPQQKCIKIRNICVPKNAVEMRDVSFIQTGE